VTPTSAWWDAVNCILEVLPVIRRQGGGRIVNVGPLAGLHGPPFLAAYSASKAALTALAQSLRAELAGSGIVIATVHADYTVSGMFAAEKTWAARRPPGPYAPATETAEAIVRGVERGRRDPALSFRGRALSVVGAVAPGIVEGYMNRLAEELRAGEE